MAEVPEGDYKACRKHLKDHPEILDETIDDSNYGKEAVQVFLNGHEGLARNCVEKGIIIHDLSSRSQEARDVYMKKLANGDPTLLDWFDQQFAKVWTGVKAQGNVRENQPVKEKHTASKTRTSSFGHGQRTNVTSWASQDQIKELTMKTKKVRIDESSEPRQPQSAGRHKEQQQPQVAEYTYDQPSGYRQTELGKIPENGPYSTKTDKGGVRHAPENPRDTRHEAESQTSHPSQRQLSIRGHGGELEDEIDDRFYRRDGRDASQFWCEYRVFALIWHTEDTGKVSLDELSEWQTKTSKGQVIRSKATRMAVVKVGGGYVWAVPINTYSGHGVGKHGFKQEHIDAHAIIYDVRSHPLEVNKYEPYMKKKPIAVDLARDQSLHRASRINFAKVHTVEWNVRAMKVGMIASKSRENFRRYWKEVLQ